MAMLCTNNFALVPPVQKEQPAARRGKRDGRSRSDKVQGDRSRGLWQD